MLKSGKIFEPRHRQDLINRESLILLALRRRLSAGDLTLFRFMNSAKSDRRYEHKIATNLHFKLQSYKFHFNASKIGTAISPQRLSSFYHTKVKKVPWRQVFLFGSKVPNPTGTNVT